MDWKSLAGKFAQMGLPILGSALGGPLGGTIGGFVGKIIAEALGVEATPEAVNNAIENGETSVVLATLKAVEAEAAERWPALAQIEGHERRAETAIAQTNAVASLKMAETAGKMAENHPILTFYRTLLMYFSTFNLIGFGVFFFYALIIDDTMWQKMVDGYLIVAWWIGANGSVLGVHFVTRSSERKAAVNLPQNNQQTTTTTTVKSK